MAANGTTPISSPTSGDYVVGSTDTVEKAGQAQPDEMSEIKSQIETGKALGTLTRSKSWSTLSTTSGMSDVSRVHPERENNIELFDIEAIVDRYVDCNTKSLCCAASGGSWKGEGTVLYCFRTALLCMFYCLLTISALLLMYLFSL
jgi:hypothetical protein